MFSKFEYHITMFVFECSYLKVLFFLLRNTYLTSFLKNFCIILQEVLRISPSIIRKSYILYLNEKYSIKFENYVQSRTEKRSFHFETDFWVENCEICSWNNTKFHILKQISKNFRNLGSNFTKSAKFFVLESKR